MGRLFQLFFPLNIHQKSHSSQEVILYCWLIYCRAGKVLMLILCLYKNPEWAIYKQK